MAVALVTDSTSDIEPALAQRLGVGVVPLFVVWGQSSYRDYVDLSRSQFYERLANDPVLPATSQPSAAMFEDAFRPLVEQGADILCITISAKLSGTMNAARAAAAQFPDARIEIVDSQNVAGGLGMLVRHADERAKSGASMDELLRSIEDEKRTQHLYCCLPDLSHIVRTGRIGKAKAALGTLMRIVPVLTLREGEVVAEAQVRTFARAQETMIDLALKSAPDLSRANFLVMHTNAPALAQNVMERLQSRLNGEPKSLSVLETGPVIAVHGGPGAVGIFTSQT